MIKEKYKNELSGKGAEKAGAKWNSKGKAMLYTSESRSLCTAEAAVHTPLGNIPQNYFLISIEIPNTIDLFKFKITDLPSDWKSLPYSNSTQLVGDKFSEEDKFLVMKVPSVVVQGDYNYLINPTHQLFSTIKILKSEAFEFNERLFKK